MTQTYADFAAPTRTATTLVLKRLGLR